MDEAQCLAPSSQLQRGGSPRPAVPCPGLLWNEAERQEVPQMTLHCRLTVTLANCILSLGLFLLSKMSWDLGIRTLSDRKG